MRSKKAYDARYRVENLEKIWARKLTHSRLRKGVLKKEVCMICGDKNTYGHHSDYNYPERIEWLCDLHHKAWHRVFEATPIEKPISPGHKKGEQSYLAKLTEAQVLEIRRLLAEGVSVTKIKNQYNLKTCWAVYRIKNRQTWKHI